MAIVERGLGTFRVVIIESERGWGQKIDEVIYFDNEGEAIEYVLDYNDEHNPVVDVVPDWYMIARYDGAVEML